MIAVNREGGVQTSPNEDLSPRELGWLEPPVLELIKRPFRRLLYSPYVWLANPLLAWRYGRHIPFPVDLWLGGQRGNDYDAHRRRLNKLVSLRDKRILVAGCGAGRDLASWLPYAPKLVVGIDYLNYASAWDRSVTHYRSKYPGSTVEFLQGDLRHLDMFQDGKFDVIGSDAVLEHVTNLSAVSHEFVRLLRPGGIVYATFGPLWYTWQGDHYSGWDSLASGYNHLIMDPASYERYFELGKFDSHPELEEGRSWTRYKLFSYLRPTDYIETLSKAGLEKQFIGVLIEPHAVRCLRRYESLRSVLLNNNEERDLLIGGMTVIYRKPLD